MNQFSLITADEKQTREPRMESCTRQHTVRTFVDVFTVTTQTHVRARWVLTALGHTVKWNRMNFKLNTPGVWYQKSKVTNRFKLQF